MIVPNLILQLIETKNVITR